MENTQLSPFVVEVDLNVPRNRPREFHRADEWMMGRPGRRRWQSYAGQLRLAVRRLESTSPRHTVLETEQVRDLDEELAAVVEKRVAGTEEAAVGSEKEVVIEILKVAVVADVNRGAGVERVGNKKIGVEVLAGGQGRIARGGAHGAL